MNGRERERGAFRVYDLPSLPPFLNTKTVFSILKLSSIDFGGDRKSYCVWSSSKLPFRFEKADHTGTLKRILNQNFSIFKLQQL